MLWKYFSKTKKITEFHAERKNGSANSITCYSTVWLRCTYFKAQNLHVNSVSRRDVYVGFALYMLFTPLPE